MKHEKTALTQRQAKRVRMTPMQKLEYKYYLKGCQINGVRPVLADFLIGAIPDSIISYMEVQQTEVEHGARSRAIAAVAGR